MTYQVIEHPEADSGKRSYAITEGGRIVISPLTRYEARRTARLLNMYVAGRVKRVTGDSRNGNTKSEH